MNLQVTIRDWTFLNYPNDCSLLQQASALWSSSFEAWQSRAIIFFWASPAQSLLILCPTRSMTIFLSHDCVSWTSPLAWSSCEYYLKILILPHRKPRFYFRVYVGNSTKQVAGSSADEVYSFFNLPNTSNITMTLGSTQPLTEMSTRNFPGGKGQPAGRADNPTAICDPTV
jgi:hypothetical protein